jgi:hypothetical protein
MSIKSASLITDGLLLDDTEPSSVKTASDRTADHGGGSDRARLSSLSRLLVDLQNSMAIDQHY